MVDSDPDGSAGTPQTDVGEPTESGAPPSPSPAQPRDPLRRSRASGMWVAMVLLVGVLVLLAIFVLQNTQPVEISFLSWTGEAPLAAAMLIATAAGLLLAVAAGSVRILQLRSRVRRERKSGAKRD